MSRVTKKTESQPNCKDLNIPPLCKKFGVIKYTGPGHWTAMHSLAARIRDESDKIVLAKYIKMLSETMGCTYCRDHCKEYLKEHPLRASWDRLFPWTIDFHNEVNLHLGKPFMELNEAVRIYVTDDEVCSSNCDESIPVTFSKVEDAPKKATVIRARIPPKENIPSFRIISA